MSAEGFSRSAEGRNREEIDWFQMPPIPGKISPVYLESGLDPVLGCAVLTFVLNISIKWWKGFLFLLKNYLLNLFTWHFVQRGGGEILVQCHHLLKALLST